MASEQGSASARLCRACKEVPARPDSEPPLCMGCASPVNPAAPMNVWGGEPGVYPPDAPPPALPGITAEDFAQMIDHAKNRRMRSFSLKTTLRGVAVELEGVFEPDPRKEPRRGE
jgi:hypothetical protein